MSGWLLEFPSSGRLERSRLGTLAVRLRTRRTNFAASRYSHRGLSPDVRALQEYSMRLKGGALVLQR